LGDPKDQLPATITQGEITSPDLGAPPVRGLTLTAIRPLDGATCEGLQQEHSAPSVKQQFAAALDRVGLPMN
jgi:hypothetical protein